MYHTENPTTQKVGQAVATVICDTTWKNYPRITTLELVYPRFIHSEFLTHRAFSRNASSSRATPVERMIREVEENPVVPAVWKRNISGMAGGEPLPPLTQEHASCEWEWAWKNAAASARELAKLGVAKEHVNRLLEPFSRIRTLVTATEWDNFFALRLDEVHVQPEMYDLALAMKQAMDASIPRERQFHLPYIDMDDVAWPGLNTVKRSVARCARVSYLTHEGREPNDDADLRLAERLLKSGHMSPFEHQARAYDPEQFLANFKGWASYRHQIEGGLGQLFCYIS